MTRDLTYVLDRFVLRELSTSDKADAVIAGIIKDFILDERYDRGVVAPSRLSVLTTYLRGLADTAAHVSTEIEAIQDQA